MPNGCKMDEQTKAGDERLGRVLRTWDGIEPRTDFKEGVWRRIRSAPVEEERGSWLDVWRDLLAPPWAWANAALVAVAVLAGVWAGTALPREARAADPLLNTDTVAGSYLIMMTGGAR